MEFQIERLIIWSHADIGETSEVRFHPGKVNVVTGESRTGKTAIVPIIDYCLGADTCTIPTGLIRESISWFGLLVRTEQSRLLIARMSPEPKRKSNSRCFLMAYPRDGEWQCPGKIQNNGCLDIKDLKRRLNEILQVPYLDNSSEDDTPDPISYRDLMHLVFQSQDVVANPNILFYKMHETMARVKFQRWLEYILGSESADSINARNLSEDLKQELKTLVKNAELDELTRASFRGKLRAFISEAAELGLYPVGKEIPEDDGPLLNEARKIAQLTDIRVDVTEEALSESEARIRRMREDMENCNRLLAIAEQRIAAIESLESQYREYVRETKDDYTRLAISDWIRKNWTNHPCSICSGNGHMDAKAALDEVIAAIELQEKVANSRAATGVERKIPRSLSGEKRALNKKRKELTLQLRELSVAFEAAISKDGDARARMRRNEDACFLIGKIRNTIDDYRRITEAPPEAKSRIEEIRKRLDELKDRIDKPAQVKERLEENLKAIGVSTQMHLKSLDADEKYAKAPVVFDRREINLKVAEKGNMDDYHLLGEIGSGSNWVSCHIAFTCALQEFFTAQDDPPSSVPNFIVYDQPSQVYFPKMAAGAIADLKNKINDKGESSDADYNAVRKMFVTLSQSIAATGGKWQAIVLEHADEGVYGGIENVEEVADWHYNNRLVPEHWQKNGG